MRNGAGLGASHGNRKYCGTPSIAQYISDGNVIRIVLNSTAAAKGFVASYKEAGKKTINTFTNQSLSLLRSSVIRK